MFRTAFCIRIFNSKNLPIFLLRRFMPLFIIPLSTLEVNDFQPMGITPAYAGKRPALLAALSQGWDHPRLCGEKLVFLSLLILLLGSPPPMRGKAHGSVCHLRHHRITPAYAGKRVDLCTISSRSKDHPRLCGEKRFHDVLLIFRRGSPPPMRGKAQSLHGRLYQWRITPAYAGKRLSSMTKWN